VTDKRGQHLLSRPTWLCTECHQPWPCGPARQRLTEESDGSRTALHMLMGGYLHDAAGELPDLSPDELWDRFQGWVRG
jgi:hypothetical protein